MIRNGQIPEYIKYPVKGTFSASLIKNPFSSTLIDIEDIINVNNEIIIYSEKEDGTQEKITSDPIIKEINLTTIKKNEHILSREIKPNGVNYTLKIKLNKIIKQYIFHRLKESRIFEKIQNNDTLKNNINKFIEEFIENEIINSYFFKRIDFFVFEEKSTNNIPKWEIELNTNKYKITNYSIDYSKMNDFLIINYTSPFVEKRLKYYFDLIWERI